MNEIIEIEPDEVIETESNETETPPLLPPKLPEGVRLPPKKAKAVKVPAAPKEPKIPWAPEQAAEDLVLAMQGFITHKDNKKILAYFVKEAIACREAGKVARESLKTFEVTEDGTDTK